MEPELYCNGFSRYAPFLSKGKQSLRLISNDDLGQRTGDSFPSARTKKKVFRVDLSVKV